MDLSLEVTSTDRSFGTILGSEVTRAYGIDAPENLCTIQCKGGGGQSFGAFLPKGVSIRLEGDSNDYFGKGLSGGSLAVYPPEDGRKMPLSRQKKTSLSATSHCTAPPPVKRLSAALRASGSVSGIPARKPSSKA